MTDNTTENPVQADINSGYLYLGGFLGLFAAGRGTVPIGVGVFQR